jgi:hypothetical protein
MEGKPFAIIGINGDHEPRRLEAMRDRIPWPSIKNERGEGKPDVAQDWNLRRWPTAYLIDTEGVIREKWLATPAIDALVEAAQKK